MALPANEDRFQAAATIAFIGLLNMSGSASEVSIALVGIGGYGNSYLAKLFQSGDEKLARLVALADPNPASCRHIAEIHRRNIPIYPTLEALEAQHSAGLTILSTPLHLHCEQTQECLRHASHVLCEKPVASTPQQASAMIEAREQSGKQVSIGYQWSFSEAIQTLKRDIAAGVLGRAKRLKTLVLWPRDEEYYRRSDWAGRCYSDTGQPIFDNPLNNACAHYLHNMMYVLGDRPDRSASPVSVKAELYRAHDIETFDTAAIRVSTKGGVEALCLVSHATDAEIGPWFSFEFEKGTVECMGKARSDLNSGGAELVVRFKDGRTKSYGSPEASPDRKLWAAIESARSNQPTVCGIEAALPQSLITDALHRKVVPFEFADSMKRTALKSDGHHLRWVEGLGDVLRHCYESDALPHEMNIPWAVEATVVAIPEWNFDNELPQKRVDRLAEAKCP